MIEIYQSPAAADRLDAARRFLQSFPPGTELLIIGAERDAVDDFVRAVSSATGATFGWHRFTLTQLAARLAAPQLAARGVAAATMLGTEAVTARAVFAARQSGALRYFSPVSHCPGFIRAVATTIGELRLAAVDPVALEQVGVAATDLSHLLQGTAGILAEAAIADRADLFRLATAAASEDPLVGKPVLLLDVAVDSAVVQEFVTALLAPAPAVFATLPSGDEQTATALGAVAPAGASARRAAASASSLARLRDHLFDEGEPPAGALDDEVCVFSAPGEARECVEMARRIVTEARSGVRFDDMAVLLRSPETYTSLLQAALQRAGVPAYFARGTRRPDPSGRAFLALLACAGEGLSAKRFAEYLSLGQVPARDEAGAPQALEPPWVAAEDESVPPPYQGGVQGEVGGEGQGDEIARDEKESSPNPLLGKEREPEPRAPWRWEGLLVEAAVLGGTERWRTRLAGLDEELAVQIAELERDDPDAARIGAFERTRAQLDELRRFALPVIGFLSELPSAATWGEWTATLERLASRLLRRPERVLAVLAELRPAAPVGPVSLAEVRDVLTPRLSAVAEDPPPRRYGRVFIGTPDQARGRVFAIVFVPGLAERIFPQRPREDPILLDPSRIALDARLATQADRGRRERLRLRLAVGAATRRVYLSYPRLELAESRPRVPSFYELDVLRACTGRLPELDELERSAAAAGEARLAWPAPPTAGAAIDAVEHDLAVLGALLHGGEQGSVKGRARYLFELNAHLARALRTRWLRWEDQRWSAADGLLGNAEASAVLVAHRLSARPYSASVLQRFAVCPYQFLLAGIVGLEPRPEVAPLERMDPLTRGRIVHAVQAALLRALAAAGQSPVSEANLPVAHDLLDRELRRVADAYREKLAPAIKRVWQDAVEVIRADLRIWLSQLATHDEWEPRYCELGFGLTRASDLDAASVAAPVTVAGGYQLRGSIDLVERHRQSGVLRVIDHKTGVNRTAEGVVTGGGQVLQPVLYALAAEAALGQTVVDARLSYCTSAGGFSERVVPIDARARAAAAEVLSIIDQAVGAGSLLVAPAAEACGRCDFQDVCGPYEEVRVARKEPRALRELQRLREMP